MFKPQTMKKPLHGLLSPSKQEKEELARKHGWEQWYHDDNWIKTEWIEQSKSVDRMGDSTDRIYARLMKNKTVKQ